MPDVPPCGFRCVIGVRSRGLSRGRGPRDGGCLSGRAAGTLKDRLEFTALGQALEVLGRRLDEIPGPYRVRRSDEEFETTWPNVQTIGRVKELLS
jgi:hypothetical protein